jgi:hypothetical protein
MTKNFDPHKNLKKLNFFSKNDNTYLFFPKNTFFGKKRTNFQEYRIYIIQKICFFYLFSKKCIFWKKEKKKQIFKNTEYSDFHEKMMIFKKHWLKL